MTTPDSRKAPSGTAGDLLKSLRRRYEEIYGNHNHLLVDTLLACYIANRLPGEPIWLMVVGAPSSGKTEALGLLANLPHTLQLSTLTEASLLSGSSSREFDAASSGGILRRCDPEGILLLKDMGSLFSMNRSRRSGLLAALREIYDGSWTRAFGSDGGKVLTWEGKVGLIGGITEEIDRHHTLRVSTGDRYLMYRLRSDPMLSLEAASRAAQCVSRHGEDLIVLRRIVESLISKVPLQESQSGLDSNTRKHLAMLACLTVRARSTVTREGGNHEIVHVPSPEEPGRLTKQLLSVFGGFLAVGCTVDEAWSGCGKLALDTIPPPRRAILELIRDKGILSLSNPEFNTSAGRMKTTIRRAIEDLESLGVSQTYTPSQGQKGIMLTDSMALCMASMLEPLAGANEEKQQDVDSSCLVSQKLHKVCDTHPQLQPEKAVGSNTERTKVS